VSLEGLGGWNSGFVGSSDVVIAGERSSERAKISAGDEQIQTDLHLVKLCALHH
jgi:hypothetical protein